ncbi:hypothetical protein, partial [Acinetobacter baumannii]|uniref:hypothetical protein n=1 Tax=Acinetobacter baumannii TaxID=470 RepID=UPI001C08D4AA
MMTISLPRRGHLAVLPSAAAIAMLAMPAFAQAPRPAEAPPRAPAAAAGQAAAAPSLPGGASSLQEAHGDWV